LNRARSALAAVLALVPAAALAHAFGARYELPVPVWLFIVGGALAVTLTFVMLAVFARAGAERYADIRWTLEGTPLGRALSALDAWITGLRREQSVTRTAVALVEQDHGHGGIVKINPLADWTSEDVWAYIREHDVPYNRLHDQGFPSIGCAPCTTPVAEGEDERAGRWRGTDKDECGIHFVNGRLVRGPLKEDAA